MRYFLIENQMIANFNEKSAQELSFLTLEALMDKLVLKVKLKDMKFFFDLG